MQIYFQGTVPADSDCPNQNKDAFCSRADDLMERVALSDGATYGSFDSQKLAKLLVDHFVAPCCGTDFCDNPFQWAEAVAKAHDEESLANSDSWDWCDKLSFKKCPSSATLLGLVFTKKTAELKVFWVGDTCVVCLEDSVIMDSVPFKCTDEFSSVPELIRSKSSENNFLHSDDFLKTHSTQWQMVPGKTTILCMTDELAAWAFKREEKNDPVWTQLCNISEQKAFEILIEKARNDKEMDYDDCTLLTIRF